MIEVMMPSKPSTPMKPDSQRGVALITILLLVVSKAFMNSRAIFATKVWTAAIIPNLRAWKSMCRTKIIIG